MGQRDGEQERLPEKKFKEAVYLGVKDYGAKEVNRNNTEHFQYRFEADGEEYFLLIGSGSGKDEGEYPIQNLLKEGYPYRICLEGETVTSVEELEGGGTEKRGTERPGYEGQGFGGQGYEGQESDMTIVHGIPGKRTLKNLLQTAMMPVGRALYIYGGGWNWQDTGSSIQTRSLGISRDWIRFFFAHDENYTYKGPGGDEDHADPAESYYPFGGYNEYYYGGLDCSGYLGWTIYNTMESEDGKEGYVGSATGFAARLADRGWGKLRQDLSALDPFVKPGDVVSIKGHVWLSLGTCRDGSILIAHSTPSLSRTGQPGGGVQIGAVGPDETCQAYCLADHYMKTRFPEWFARYPAALKEPEVYMDWSREQTGCFSWDTGEGGCLSDPEGIRNMEPREVMQMIFSENVQSPERIRKLGADRGVSQIFEVRAWGKNRTRAEVSFHEKEETGAWKQIFTVPAYVGKRGLCPDVDHYEGCGQTPMGIYRFNKAFGIGEDPGCRIPYIKVTEDLYWSGDQKEGMHYNEMVDIRDIPDLDREVSEHLIELGAPYRYCLSISFNETCQCGRGSAIFLHCFNPGRTYTEGCVTVSEDIMIELLGRVRQDCLVIIDVVEKK